jgi:hypothetical protein
MASRRTVDWSGTGTMASRPASPSKTPAHRGPQGGRRRVGSLLEVFSGGDGIIFGIKHTTGPTLAAQRTTRRRDHGVWRASSRRDSG